MARTSVHAIATAALALLLCACTCAGERDAVRAGTEAVAGDWSERLAQPSVKIAVDALAQGHAQARDHLGAHRLTYDAEFSLTPEGDVPDARVGKAVPAPQNVVDHLELKWTSEPGEAPRFLLTQHNNHDRGREVIVVDDTIYTRLVPRPWYHRPVESEVHELWLDDAQRAAGDALALAAHRATITATPIETTAFDQPAVKLSFALGDNHDADLEPKTGWRHRATIDDLSGEITLLTRSGLWLAATLNVRYRLENEAGFTVRGEVRFSGTVEPLGSGADVVSAPADAQPTPNRTRYEVERKKLLDGLAAP